MLRDPDVSTVAWLQLHLTGLVRDFPSDHRKGKKPWNSELAAPSPLVMPGEIQAPPCPLSLILSQGLPEDSKEAWGLELDFHGCLFFLGCHPSNFFHSYCVCVCPHVEIRVQLAGGSAVLLPCVSQASN